MKQSLKETKDLDFNPAKDNIPVFESQVQSIDVV